MGKKENWFTYVKRLFISDPKPTTQKKSKSRKRFIEKFKFKHYPAIKPSQRNQNNAAEERRKHAIAMANATKAAAEAAVAAANAAAEVVRLTSMAYEFERKNLHLAANKIQAFYRGHLARKALRALKGVVKLQAVVRGDLVRRNMINELQLYPAFLDRQNEYRTAKLRSAWKQEIVEDLNPPSTLLSRRSSFSRVKKKAVGHDETVRVFPAYMAATESTKAKLRSPNTPKQRIRLSDVCCSQDSPSKLSLSSWSSFNQD